MIVVRKMEEKDLDTVTAIEADCFSQPWSRQGFLEELKNKDALYLIALEQEQGTERIAGYCGLLRSFETAEILNVAVKEDCRHKGIARKLLEELMKRGRAWGVERFTLEVRAGNEPAIALYESLGFATVGTRKGFYALPKEDAKIMWTE